MEVGFIHDCRLPAYAHDSLRRFFNLLSLLVGVTHALILFLFFFFFHFLENCNCLYIYFFLILYFFYGGNSLIQQGIFPNRFNNQIL